MNHAKRYTTSPASPDDRSQAKKVGMIVAASLLAGAIAFSQALGGLDQTGASPLVVPLFRDPISSLNQVRLGPSEDQSKIVVADPARAVEVARKSISAAALNPGAIYLLAVIADARGNKAKATQYATLVERISRRHVGGQMMLVAQAMGAERYEVAVSHFDRALRTNPEIASQIFPVFAQALQSHDFRKYLAVTLKDNAPWRDAFLAYSAAQPYAQEGTAQVILQLPKLKDSADLRLVVRELSSGLAASRKTDLLRRVYARFPAVSVGLVSPVRPDTFTDFALVEGAPPVAWDVAEDTTNGALVSKGKTPGSVNINAWAESGYGGIVATKLLWLPAGQWTLRYSGSGHTGGTGAGANWQLKCVTKDAITPLAASVDIFANGGSRSLGFTVPSPCSAVVAELTVRGSESGGASQIDLVAVTLAKGSRR